MTSTCYSINERVFRNVIQNGYLSLTVGLRPSIGVSCLHNFKRYAGWVMMTKPKHARPFITNAASLAKSFPTAYARIRWRYGTQRASRGTLLDGSLYVDSIAVNNLSTFATSSPLVFRAAFRSPCKTFLFLNTFFRVFLASRQIGWQLRRNWVCFTFLRISWTRLKRCACGYCKYMKRNGV